MSGGRALSRRAILALLFATPAARALGRVPYAGTVELDLPLSLDRFDPHAADDPASALLSAAVFDTLYAWDGSGNSYPTLAQALPTATAEGSRILLRAGLVTARGRSLDGADLIASLERARRLAARPIFASFGAIRRVRGDPLAIDVIGGTPEAVADALSSPATAVVPRTFSPKFPDGTGAFRADLAPGTLSLVRNDRAARGPSFLDRMDVRRADDLAVGLRDFESGAADIGFLGAGLHRRRTGAVDFRTERRGWVIFRTGGEARDWGAPGVAARLVEALDPARLSHLGLTPALTARGSRLGWGGTPANLYVDEASAYLVEVARAVAAALSDPGHEIRPFPLPHDELVRLRDSGRFAVMIDFARLLGPTERHAMLSLLGAANPRLAESVPRSSREDVAVLERTLSLAILGELRLQGARGPDLHGLEQMQGELGSVWKSH